MKIYKITKDDLIKALEAVLGNKEKYYLGYCNNGNDFSLVERDSSELADEIIDNLQSKENVICE